MIGKTLFGPVKILNSSLIAKEQSVFSRPVKIDSLSRPLFEDKVY